MGMMSGGVDTVPRATPFQVRMGWTVERGLLSRIHDILADIERVSLEQVEAVIVALCHLGYVRCGVGPDPERMHQRVAEAYQALLHEGEV